MACNASSSFLFSISSLLLEKKEKRDVKRRCLGDRREGKVLRKKIAWSNRFSRGILPANEAHMSSRDRLQQIHSSMCCWCSCDVSEWVKFQVSFARMKNLGEKLKSLVWGYEDGEEFESVLFFFDRLQNSHLLTCVMRQQTTTWDVNVDSVEIFGSVFLWKMMMKMKTQHAKISASSRRSEEITWKISVQFRLEARSPN